MLTKHISQYSDQELDQWIQHLVDDETPESMTLEYKSIESFSNSFKSEIAKDISSFANTRGGAILYGIPEREINIDHEQRAIPSTQYGVEKIPNFVSRLEDILTDTISPHLPDLWIREVAVSRFQNQFVYIVWHPESWLVPHMLQGYRDYRYYKRGLLRTIEMTEPEIRDKYARVNRAIEKSESFLESKEINYIYDFFPDNHSVSQIVSCPHILVPQRVEYTSNEFRQWLESNIYPQSRLSHDRSSITWYPSIHGVQVGMVQVPFGLTTGTTSLRYWIEMHRNGAVNCIWQSFITEHQGQRLLNWYGYVQIMRDFIDFIKRYYSVISYYGPIRIKSHISRLGSVELKPDALSDPLAAQLPNNEFTAYLIEDSATLFTNENIILQTLADRLFQAYGRWAAPRVCSME